MNLGDYDRTVFPLFNNPLYVSRNAPLSAEIVEYVVNQEYYSDPQEKNGENSADQRLLDGCPELKALVERHLNHYLYNILCFDKRYVARHHCSWATRHKTGHSAHKHTHCNSMYSGVIYIKTPPNCGDILFHADSNRDTYTTPAMRPDIVEHNIYNSACWSIPAEEALILLFPSTVEHSVEPNRSLSDRYSVAFNYWLHGQYGDCTNRLTI